MISERQTISATELAARYGVDVQKVNAWCESGQLPAINVASDPKKRKQYRIAERDIEAFERVRNVANTPAANRKASRVKRNRPLAVKRYF